MTRLHVAIGVVWLISTSTLSAIAQSGDLRHNAVFLEGLGSGGLYSINYDRTIASACLRAGVSYAAFNVGGDRLTLVTAPAAVTYLFGTGPVRFETGGAVMLFHWTLAPASNLSVGPRLVWTYGATAILGLRYTSPAGFLFRLTFTPVIMRADPDGGTFAPGPWGGASLGYAF